jgi:CrcB protein
MDVPEPGLWHRVLPVALVALGGAAGAVTRFGLAAGVNRISGVDFPLGSMAVNALGCLGFGLITGLIAKQNPSSEWMVFFLIVGFMGSFTTFSTYAFESMELMRDGRWWSVSANLLIQNVVGMALVLLGMQMGRWTMGPAA